MNSLELAYTVTILRRLTESANQYIEDGSWVDNLDNDLKVSKALLKAYDKRLNNQLQEGNIA